MATLLTITELNSYSRLVYNNNKSTLDAAFELLLNPYYSDKITSNIFKNQTATFILYMYTIVYLQLLSDSDNSMLCLAGDNDDLKLFAYNIIYFYDNQNEENDEYNDIVVSEQKNICSNDIFYYIISQYLNNCDRDDNNNIYDYETSITDFINSIYDYEELIELNTDKKPAEDWEIYIYVISYNYICLFQDIKNGAFTPNFLLNIKNYLNSCIIVYCMNIIINESLTNPAINIFLNEQENQYFSNIIDRVQAIFYENNDIRFDITNCPRLFSQEYKGEKLLERIFYDVIGYYTHEPSTDNNVNLEIINKFKIYQYNLCQMLNITEEVFQDQIGGIQEQIQQPNLGSLKDFYDIFLSKLTINSDKIDLIKKKEENIYLLNNNFEECFYSLILGYHNKQGDTNYINQIIINLCNNINNINLNYELNKKIQQINKKISKINKKPNLDAYFFNNFNIHFKLQQLNNYQNDDTDETEYCDAFYFPNNLSLDNVNYVDLDDNITMGLFNLSEKNSPPIKLETTVLFDSDPIIKYCRMDYTLTKTDIAFVIA